MFSRLDRIKKTCRRAVWEVDITQLSPLAAGYTRLLRVLYTVFHELGDGQLNLRAMSLVYTTLLALVPLLAVSFSVLKAFGVHNQLEQLMLNVLSPLGDKGVELTLAIIEFVDNVKVGVLGSVGLILLFYTVVSMIQKIERAFNYTWRVNQPRSVTERFSDYLSVLIIGPVFLFTALGITATISGTAAYQRAADVEFVGSALHTFGKVVPYLLVIGAFTFIYKFIPNTLVYLKSALIGGVVAGILWESAGWIFASIVVTSTQYTAIYSSFAVLVLFMIWLYLNWLILLVGASVAFYTQNPQYLGLKAADLRLSARLRERIALQAVYLIVRDFCLGGEGWTIARLTQRFDVPAEPLTEICDALEQADILAMTSEDGKYLPAKDVSCVTVGEVLDVVRAAEEQRHFQLSRFQTDARVEALTERLDEAWRTALAHMTIKDLAMGTETSVPGSDSE